MTRSEFSANAGLQHTAAINTATQRARYDAACRAFKAPAPRRAPARFSLVQCFAYAFAMAPVMGYAASRFFG